jgi:hypothetical protein
VDKLVEGEEKGEKKKGKLFRKNKFKIQTHELCHHS